MIYSYYTDISYLNAVGFRLEGFKEVNNVFNCRCPFCGDSKKKNKQRFYFYTKKGNLNTQCKNCGYSKSFYNFLKEYDPGLFQDYRKEVLLDHFRTNQTMTSVSIEKKEQISKPRPETLFECVRVSDLEDDHIAVKYCKSRCFDSSIMKRLFYTSSFKTLAENFNLESSKTLINEQRLVIPFYDENNKIKAIQGRALDNSKMRYITLKVDETCDKIFGLEQINFDEKIYCVEGPFDSMFVNNCVATCDSNLLKCDFADVLVFDNQCRNKEIIDLMDRAIKKGFSIVVWPSSTNQKQDINDIIKAGVSRNMLMKVLEKRTFSGIRALLELQKWKKA